MVLLTHKLNTLRSRQNRHFADKILKHIFFNKNVWISIKISLKFVPKGPINNIPALVQIMVWHWPGYKPLFGPMMVSLLAHICITQPHWVNHGLALVNFTHILEDYFTVQGQSYDWVCYQLSNPIEYGLKHHNNPLTPGPRLNIKTVFPGYGDSHVKDKTAVRTSYL